MQITMMVKNANPRLMLILLLCGDYVDMLVFFHFGSLVDYIRFNTVSVHWKHGDG